MSIMWKAEKERKKKKNWKPIQKNAAHWKWKKFLSQSDSGIQLISWYHIKMCTQNNQEEKKRWHLISIVKSNHAIMFTFGERDIKKKNRAFLNYFFIFLFRFYLFKTQCHRQPIMGLMFLFLFLFLLHILTSNEILSLSVYFPVCCCLAAHISNERMKSNGKVPKEKEYTVYVHIISILLTIY